MTQADNFTMAYLDSCILTRYFGRKDGWQQIERIMQAADAGQIDLCTSMFTMVECLSQPPSRSPDIGQDANVMAYLDSNRIMLIEFHREIAVAAREMHLNKEFKDGDAIHMASAIEAEADVLFTFDTDFPIGEKYRGIRIERPFLPGDPTLFD